MKFGLKDLFKDVTWMQVGAGALAAATSLFLASSIGIAGSVIGAAVGSVVTTLSSALYKSFLTASNDAIKEKIVGPGAEKTTVLSTAEKTRAIGTIGAQPTRPCTDELTGEGQAGAAHRPAGTCQPTVALPPYGGARVPSHAPDEVERVKDLARRRKKQRINRIAAVVSLVTGIIAVAACAAVVYLATDGAGLGYRPEPQGRAVLPAPSVTAPPDEGATADSVGDADEPGTADDAGETGGAGATGNPAAPTPDAPAQPPADTEAAAPPAGGTDEEPATPTPPADEGAGDASTGDTDTGEGTEPEEGAAGAGDDDSAALGGTSATEGGASPSGAGTTRSFGGWPTAG